MGRVERARKQLHSPKVGAKVGAKGRKFTEHLAGCATARRPVARETAHVLALGTIQNIDSPLDRKGTPPKMNLVARCRRRSRTLRRLLTMFLLLWACGPVHALTWGVSLQGNGLQKWRSITSSSDGTKLAAVVSDTNGNIWTSTDSGATWTENTSTGSAKDWWSITSSSDGTKLAAVVDNGNIWTPQTRAPRGLRTPPRGVRSVGGPLPHRATVPNLPPYNCEEAPTQGDGNCQFRALSLGL